MPKDVPILPEFVPAEITAKPVPTFTYRGCLKRELEGGKLAQDDALRMFRYMLAIRCFEEMIVTLKGGRFAPLPGLRFIGATHLSIGQEAVAVGSISAIDARDYITSTHRGHGHSVAKTAFAMDAMSDSELIEYTGLPADTDNLRDQALNHHLYRTLCELLGKEDGYCHGRGGGMHIADFNTGHLGANAIVGGSIAIATGAAMACEKLGDGKVVLCLMGDGAANNGICHEAFNFAAQDQFEKGCPVIFLIENNQYGMTGQSVGEVTGVRYLAQRGMGYNEESMHAEVVDGMNLLAVRDAVQRAAELCRQGKGPVLLECLTYRYFGHSLSDNRMSYRTKEEETAWLQKDPIEQFQCELVDAGVLTQEQAAAERESMKQRVEWATVAAANSADPDISEITRGLLAETTSDDIPASLATPESALMTPYKKVKRDSEGAVLYRHAVAEAIAEEMLRDRRVILYGEDVADYGGAFGATRGLIEVFGRDRVFNAPISEAGIIGTGAGAAMVGMRPIVEIMYIDFIFMTMDQTGNQAAKARYMFGGKCNVPMVIRTTIGGGKGYAGQHSQSLEAVCTQVPGLKVVAPSTAYDCKGLLKAAVRDDNCVVFIEHQNLYTEKGVCPEDDYTIPLGKGIVRREGSDITVVAYSYMAPVALQAAEMVAEEGISVEMVDPRTLRPLDVDLIASSVSKTGRLLVVCQAPKFGCFGETIAYTAQERCFSAMKAPAKIIAAYDVPPPMAAPLEKENLPTPEKVAAAIRELCGR